jgi:hypothetical protein
MDYDIAEVMKERGGKMFIEISVLMFGGEIQINKTVNGILVKKLRDNCILTFRIVKYIISINSH